MYVASQAYSVCTVCTNHRVSPNTTCVGVAVVQCAAHLRVVGEGRDDLLPVLQPPCVKVYIVAVEISRAGDLAEGGREGGREGQRREEWREGKREEGREEK